MSREAGSGTRAVFEAALRAHDQQAAPAVTMGHSEAVTAAVRTGLGVGCLSTLAIRVELDSGAFVRLRVDGLDLTRRLWRLSRRSGYRSALQRAFASFGADEGSAPAAGRVRRPIEARDRN